jgi:CTP synthase
MSGLGKGILTSSIGKSLQARGLKVVPIKFDGYLNVDCGTMNPYRHGEVFVLEDGYECDMDFGTYERFLNMDFNTSNSITGGKVFRHIIDKERKGDYLGSDVQIVPHLTNEIKGMVRKVGSAYGADVLMIEVGGTVGDMENSYFIEAMRQLAMEEKGGVLFIQLTYVPMLDAVGEQKTKPTQHATRILQGLGIQPEIIVCRGNGKLTQETKRKIAMFCNVEPEAVIDDPDLESIYEVPMSLERQNLGSLIIRKLGLKGKEPDLRKWSEIVGRIKEPKGKVTVAITGKYTALKDSYASIKEALVHAGAYNDCAVKIRWVETTDIEDGKESVGILKDCDGVIVPGGYGSRGTEGKIQCIRYARENDIPYLGLCFGMQYMTIEFARDVCGLKAANSTEADPKTAHPVVELMPDQSLTEMGATNRLGAREIDIRRGTLAHRLYGKEMVMERFRHRYEVNPKYVERLEKAGLTFSGTFSDGKIMEIAEYGKNRFHLGTQFHPEFTSRLERPSPVFVGFVAACLARSAEKGGAKR